MKECLAHIRKSYKDVFKFPLTYFNYPAFEKDQIFLEIEFLRKSLNPIFKQNVASYTWNGQVYGLEI